MIVLTIIAFESDMDTRKLSFRQIFESQTFEVIILFWKFDDFFDLR